MSVLDKMKKTLDQGAHASKGLYDKAVDKAKELGETGVRKVEILQLENQVKDLKNKLGTIVFALLEEQSHTEISPETPGVREILNKMKELQDEILRKS